MSRFSILLGGELRRTPELNHQIADTRVIAADVGIGHAAVLELKPELWVGDFDSVPDEMARNFSHVPREIFPPAKDKTDGEIAIEAALRLGATSLVLIGAFGGSRPDHSYLHMVQAIRLAENGVPTLLTSGSQEGCAILEGQRHVYDYPEGTVFSILVISDLSGLTVEGAKWPLDAVEVPLGSSLTMSNEVQGRLAVTLQQGRALLFADFLAEGTN
ncbi:thiamine diphosphokinase [Chelativorans sp. YIM 93263]|uniref:thiamine diphosphokinase n=1 Tax=Chelativorans sp. YIM 93263 TaxID=2906648 RepID=UPI0023782711|nr:thiamine diphosphokinase [Chelativorans sp. YIM 93263]